MVVEEGNKIKVHYTGTLDDGTKFDSSEGKEPLEFVVGEKKVIPGFEKAVVGMEEGQEKEFKIEAEEAYGPKNPQLIQEVPKKALPEGMEVKEGTMLMLKAPTGQNVPATVTEDKGESIMIDLNHPLAGKNLNFKIKLETVEPATKE